MTQTRHVKVRYVGPFPEGVYVRHHTDPDHFDYVAYRGTYTTTLEHAKSLLEQDSNWESASKHVKEGD